MATATLEFIGTATSLVRLGEFTLLTDPNFLHHGQRAYLGKGLFSKRVTEPRSVPRIFPAWTRWCFLTCMVTISIGSHGAVLTPRCPS